MAEIPGMAERPGAAQPGPDLLLHHCFFPAADPHCGKNQNIQSLSPDPVVSSRDIASDCDPHHYICRLYKRLSGGVLYHAEVYFHWFAIALLLLHPHPDAYSAEE